MKSISEHQKFIYELYDKQNEHFSWDYIWGYLSRTSTYLFRAIENKKATGYEFIKSFSWLFSLANKVDIDFQDAVLRRFPDMCPYCLRKPCCCIKTNKRPTSGFMYLKDIQRELNDKYDSFKSYNKETMSFEFFSNLLFDIYPQNKLIWDISGLDFHFKKVHEELAEVHESISKYEKEKTSIKTIEDEFADVFAWLISTWRIFSDNKCLTDEFLLYYKDNCPVCKQKECKCGLRNERNQGLFEIMVVEETLSILSRLLGSKYSNDVQKHYDSIKTAKSEKDNYSIRTSTLQANTFLEQIQNNNEEDIYRRWVIKHFDKIGHIVY